MLQTSDFLRNLINFPFWAIDICITKSPAYCMQVPFYSENLG
ncbi:hypothetical protein T4B_4565 [Trichinella pseudospiralis]|uniref:Uncharacterized protein n=1 Tax=Trichinella pseudospiralis TaxID=6337 RepID=A0A0V1GFZ2_TRIPS|nr:hypothetical protein T4B_4565 [Trichinella pseudospiralis]